MFCEIGTNHGFVALWLVMSVLGLLTMILFSGAVFYPYYANPTFERWKMKTNAKFPSPGLVKKEIIHMCKGLSVATLCPAFALMASKWGYLQGYCGAGNGTEFSLLVQTVIIFVFTDFVEYGYHLLGHKFSFLWSIHRHHHMFYNPSPFSVIADEYLDQFVRTLPMVAIPFMMQVNMDLLFGIFVLLFYGYGVYLHMGYESKALSAHNPFFNTSYHHYMHHAISAKGRPLYTGFFFNCWDHLFDTGYKGACICHECRPERTIEEWNATVKPDYSVLLSVNWWMTSEDNATV